LALNEEASMPEFERDGWKLFYEDTGEGPPILLIHGLLMDHTMFEPQVAALGNRYRVMTPDLRGHGASQHRDEEHTQWDLMEDHIALLDHLGIEQAMWGGVSQGGFQSLRGALRHPERVAGLILIDSQAGSEDENRRPMYEAFAEVVATDGWNDHILENCTISMFGTSASEDLKHHWIERWRAEETFDARQTLWAVTKREDITDRLPEIKQPAVVIHGEEDAAIDMVRAEQLADGLPNLVEFVTVPRAGHSSTVEQPEMVTEAMERFLQKVYPA
jgi:pimeloyl-ACP methyl ester carboxylesterase